MPGDLPDGLIDRIYGCALTPDGWPDVLGELACFLDAASGDLLLMETSSDTAWFRSFGSAEPPKIGALRPFCNPAAVTATKTIHRKILTRPASTVHAVPTAAVRGYNGTVLLAELRTESGILGSVRFISSESSFGGWQKAALCDLTPHLVRAARVQHAAEQERQRQALLAHAFDALPDPLLLLGRNARFLLANRVARVLLAQEDGLSEHQGHLRAWRPQDSERLRAVLRSALAGTGGTDLALTRPSGKRPLLLTVQPIDVPLKLPKSVQAASLLVFVLDPERTAPPSPGRLRALFGLSAREAALAAGLAQGLCLADTAHRLGITYETARVYLKQVFQKTGVSRQAELVSLVSRC